METGLKDKIIRWTAGILLIAIVIGGMLFVWPTYLRRKALLKQDAELTRRIEEKRREIAELDEYQRRFKTDPDFVEHIARQNRRVFPGELVFVFEEEEKK